ncbi:thiosulfate sulfurtransferase (rhodanese)-like domain-containing protein 2 [Phytophthora pseudosyringae]|uniref:Thiosulfate sulfurtransferase (Rhodanese)-like domain-containing protein 2 n=1 Tax=Phytophthora pseudosyringae TaxID=221518 RepID=A0A8T1WD56_9STRA|nr:thiosulfate sulfurtransferase (rhodanese)-like domain-containing protein 2 [Phytophthora pseudosyringae]
MGQDDGAHVVVLYYKYVRLCETPEELAAFAAAHERLCASLGLTGRVRLALEGINGTLGGSSASVQSYVNAMKQRPQFADVDWKTSRSQVEPFAELQVRVVAEIVALELPADAYDLSLRGEHLSPEQFRSEQLQADPDSIALIDVRNTYEFNVGHFAGALNPKTRRFGQFPQWVKDELPVLQQKDKVFMYCTGGIRCEKASAYLKHLGLERVYQLEGGIHRYLERFPDGGGLFQGKNFVFDQRVTMASEDRTVTGQCERCHVPHDTLSGARCAYCRMHVLLCASCRGDAEACGETDDDVFCAEHLPLVSGSLEDLQTRATSLQDALSGERGRARKGRRRSLRKQLDTVERRIQQRRVPTPTA